MLEKRIIHTGPFKFEVGTCLEEGIDIAFHCSPRPYTPGEKVIWICHGLTANSNPEEWWPDMVGPGKKLDPEKYFIVCVNMLCSPYGSSCPASVNPATGKPYLMSFPKTTVRDIVQSNIIVRQSLGIEKIDLMLGPSIGGYQALEWSIMEADRIREAIFLATSIRVSPYITAYNESQRMALLADPTFLEAANVEGGKVGLACARSIALISYRNYDCYDFKQSEPDPDTLFAERACSYQRYQGKKLVDRFDAYSYWYLATALDSQNIGRGRGGVDSALKEIKAKCTVIAIDTDELFPPKQAKRVAAALEKSTYREITSLYGHDGFLLEYDQLTAILNPILERL